MSWWWLSFCDPDRPVGQQFLGACVVPGHDVGDAIQRAWADGCNPGGEVCGVAIDEAKLALVPPGWRRVLLTVADCELFNRTFPFEGENAFAMPSARLAIAVERLS